MSRATPRRSAAVLSRAAATAIVASSIFIISACGDQDDTQSPATSQATDASQATTAPPAPSMRGSELPVDTTLDLSGSRDTTCPYLDGEWVQGATGQKLTGVSLDPRFDPPGCVFWSFEEDPQVQLSVRKMRSNSEAVAVVDSAAPIDSTLKALQPDGWSGGRGSNNENGAVYAVWKDTVAVVVTTAQPQSVKAQQIAERTIANLQL